MPFGRRGLRSVVAGATAAVLCALPLNANAQTITFSALGGANGSFFSSYIEAGFAVDLFSGFICAAQVFGDPVPDLFGGTQCAGAGATASTIRIQKIGGGSFTFLGADMSSNIGSSAYVFAGLVAASSVYSNSASFNFGNATFGAVNNASSGIAVDEILISLDTQGASSYNIDNIRLSSATVSTPEPASVALMATGLIGLATFRARRRRAS